MESKLKSISTEDLRKIVSESFSFSEVLFKLKYKNRTSGFYFIKFRIENENISTKHFKRTNKKNRNIQEVLVENSRLDSGMKNRIIKEILGEKCSATGCLLGPIWNGKPLKLQIDHINGDPYDNRIENLRVLCPNCHTQTPTFGTKNIKREITEKECCYHCAKNINKRNSSKMCRKCYNLFYKKRPNKQRTDIYGNPIPVLSLESLIPFFYKKNKSEICEMFKTSYKTINKILKNNNIPNDVFNIMGKSQKQKALYEKMKGKPNLHLRKQNYEEVYSHYINNGENYQKTGKHFNIHRSHVMQIVKKYINSMSKSIFLN